MKPAKFTYRRVAMLLTVALVAICVSIDALSLDASTSPNSDTRYEISVVGDREFGPYDFIDEHGQPSGFMTDMLREVLNREKISYRIRMRNHSVALSRIHSGEADIMISAYNVPGGDSSLLYSRPLERVHPVAVCSKTMKPFTIDDLRNYKVLIVDNTMLDKAFSDYIPAENRVLVDNVQDALRLVQTEAYDVAVFGLANAQYYLHHQASTSQYQGIEIRELYMPFYEVCFGINSKRTDLLNRINAQINDMMLDGTYDRIYAKWYSANGPDENITPPQVKWLIGVCIAVILVLVIIVVSTMSKMDIARRGVIVAAQDETKLRRQNEVVLDALPVGVALYDYTGRLTYLNRVLADMFSISDIDAYLSQDRSIYALPFISEDNKFRIRKHESFDFVVAYNSETNTRFTYAFLSPEDSAYFECKMRSIDFGNSDDPERRIMCLVVNDITATQNSAQALREQRNCLNMALYVGKLTVWSLNVATARVTNLYCDLETGESEEFALNDLYSMIHPDDLPKLLNVLHRLISEAAEVINVELKMRMQGATTYQNKQMRLRTIHESSGKRSQNLRILMVMR